MAEFIRCQVGSSRAWAITRERRTQYQPLSIAIMTRRDPILVVSPFGEGLFKTQHL